MSNETTFTPAAGRPEWTPFYDFAIAILTRERRWRSALLRETAPQAGDRILDVGCGTGTFAVMLKRHEPGAHVVGLDPDADGPAIIAVAKGRREDERGRRIADRSADATGEQIFMPGRAPFLLPPRDPALFLIQRLRDEPLYPPMFAAAFPANISLQDRFKDENVSPQATLRYKPDRNTTYYAAYKEGFKSGGFNISQSLTPGASVAAGEFDSETAKGFEAGLRLIRLGGALSRRGADPEFQNRPSRLVLRPALDGVAAAPRGHADGKADHPIRENRGRNSQGSR